MPVRGGAVDNTSAIEKPPYNVDPAPALRRTSWHHLLLRDPTRAFATPLSQKWGGKDGLSLADSYGFVLSHLLP